MLKNCRQAMRKQSEPRTSEWIQKQVSDSVAAQNPDVNASRLTQSVELLARGVPYWNRWRKSHPAFVPYLVNANLSWTNQLLEDLSSVDFSNAQLDGVNFEGQALYDSNLSGASLRRANFTDAGLERAIAERAQLNFADLSEAHLGFANFDQADLSYANLSDAEMWCASFHGANLTRAILDRSEANEIHASGADFSFARLLETDLEQADLSNADLTYATLVRTNLKSAILTGAKVYGASVWDTNLEMAQQSRLVVNQDDQSPVLVDDLEMAQFVHLLLNHNKLRKAINAVAERGVLILGRFSDGGLAMLEVIAAALRKLNYLPIIFDFARPESRSYTETVITLAGLSKFIIADLSGRSVPQELYAVVPHFKIPVIPILAGGKKAHALFTDILEYPWVIKPVLRFGSKAQLTKLISADLVAKAEEVLQNRRLLLGQLNEQS